MDSKTLAVALIIVLACLSLLASLVAVRRRDRALTIWAGGLVGICLGFLLLLFQASYPATLLLFFANFLLLAYNASLPWGLRVFFGFAKPWPWRITVLLCVWAIITLWFSVVAPSYQGRVILTSACMGALTLESLVVLFLRRAEIPRSVWGVLMGSGLVFLGLQLARVILVQGDLAASFFSDHELSSFTLAAVLGLVVLWAGGLLLLDSHRLHSTVQGDALELRRLNLLKDRVLAMTGHDLRGPLGNLKLIWSELAAQARAGKSIDLDPELFGLVDRSLAGTQDLLDNLFSFAEAQKGTSHPAEEVSLTSVASAVANLWAATAQTKGVNLRFQGSQVLVKADFEGVSAVLRNLVGNAIKFTPEGGEVLVRVENSPSGAFLEVVDTGIGMEVDRDPGHSLVDKSSRPGTAGERGSGFGLVLVRELVASWNAKLTIDSTPGRGTTVRVTFPA